MIGRTLFILILLMNTLFLLVFVISLGITSAAPILLHFNLGKYHWYFPFRFLTTVYFFYCLFWNFSRLNKYAVPWLFVDRVQKLNSYLSVGTLFFKNMTGSFCPAVRYGFSALFANTLTADHMNSIYNRDKFVQHVQSLLYIKPKVFSQIFFPFLHFT